MLGKTLILGLISASAAGGIVYYGTAPQGLEALEARPSDGIKAETSLKKVESAVKKGENATKKAEIGVKKGNLAAKKERERIEPRLPTVRKSEADDGREKLASAGGLPVSTNVSANKDMPPEVTETTDVQPKKQNRWLDQYLQNNNSEPFTTEAEAEPAAVGEAEAEAEPEAVGEAEAQAEPEAVGEAEAQAEPEAVGEAEAQPRTFRIENGQLVEISAADDVTKDVDTVVDDAVTEIMEEAIQAPKIRTKSGVHSGSAYRGGKARKAKNMMSKSDMSDLDDALSLAEMSDEAVGKNGDNSGSAYRGGKARKAKNMMSKSDMSDLDDALSLAEISDEAMDKSGEHAGSSYKGDKPRKDSHKFNNDITDMADDNTPLLSTVMREAAAIEKSELRDQAYFEITEFALSEGRFDSARLAHDMIEQDELSYTAKSRIAVAYAQNGQPTKAFKVIGEVDETELRDFMRLQVIEALIAPQNLPQAWQEKAN